MITENDPANVIKRELWARLDEVMTPVGSMHQTELGASTLGDWLGDRVFAALIEAGLIATTCSCGSSPMTYEGPEPDCPVHGAVRAFNEARAEVASLRQQLDEARAQAEKWRNHSVTLNSVGYRIAEALSDAKGAEQYVGNPSADVDRLIADNARLLDVYRAAEAWRDNIVRSATGSGVVTLDEVNIEADMERKLIASVAAYRAGTPAEPGVVSAPLISAETAASPQPLLKKFEYTIPGLDGTWRLMGLETTNMGADGRATLHLVRWTPANDGDTPGELVPGEGEQQQPVLCGTDCIEPRHEPNWDQDFLDFPTAWWIQEQGFGHTDERCSAVQSNGALLCDCGAVEADWKRLRDEKRGVPVDTEEEN